MTWNTALDGNGTTYYWNEKGESTYERPFDFNEATAESAGSYSQYTEGALAPMCMPCKSSLPVAAATLVEDGGLPSTWWLTGWAGVAQLPPLPQPARCDLCCERAIGKFVVGMLITMFVGITYAASMQSSIAHSDAAKFCRALIYLEAVVAISCLVLLQYFGSLFAVRRSPERCFPLPDLIVQRMQSLDSRSYDGSVTRALQLAVGGLGNIADPEKIRGVYCVRCFCWRAEDAHHCSECQRCTEDFDHHCGVLGCCVGGRGCTGNMWQFTSLLLMAAAGLITMLFTAVLLTRPHAAEYTMSMLVSNLVMYSGGLALAVYGAYRGFVWFFYDRHAHRRVNKRQA